MFWLGMFVGAVVTGWVAHRKPQWFARVVAEANVVTDTVRERVSDEVQQAVKGAK